MLESADLGKSVPRLVDPISELQSGSSTQKDDPEGEGTNKLGRKSHKKASSSQRGKEEQCFSASVTEWTEEKGKHAREK